MLSFLFGICPARRLLSLAGNRHSVAKNQIINIFSHRRTSVNNIPIYYAAPTEKIPINYSAFKVTVTICGLFKNLGTGTLPPRPRETSMV